MLLTLKLEFIIHFLFRWPHASQVKYAVFSSFLINKLGISMISGRVFRLIFTFNAVEVLSYDTTAKPVYVDRVWFHSELPSLHRCQLNGIHSTQWKVNCALSLVGSTETCGRVVKQVHNLVFAICHYSIPSYCPYLWTKVEWTTGRSANDWGFRPVYRITLKLYNYLGRPT